MILYDLHVNSSLILVSTSYYFVMMYQPTRMMYNNPRDNFQFKCRQNSGPRAMNWRNNVFHNASSNGNHEEHWCETCDRSFPTSVLLQNHKQQHQKCNIDGCQFVAHPKVITKHIQMQHSSGLYKKIAKLANPEEINKWREERKKKYPTISNIEKKAAEVKEKIDRGEKMGLQYDKGFRNSRSGMTHKRKHEPANENQNKPNFKRNNSNFQANNKATRKKQPPNKNISRTLPPVDEKRKLKPFTGIHEILICDTEEEVGKSVCNDLIEDDALEKESDMKKDAVDTNEPVVCGALSSLMCDYGSSDEEIDYEIEHSNKTNDNKLGMKNPQIEINQSKVDKSPRLLDHNTETQLTNCLQTSSSKDTVKETNKSDDDSGPDEVTTVTSKEIEVHQGTRITNLNTSPVIKKKDQIRHDQKKVIPRRPKPKVPSTLLRKLLFKEMRQERNIVLQCIRYIKRNNYFNK